MTYPHDLAAPAARAGWHRVRPRGHWPPSDPSARLADMLRDGWHVEALPDPASSPSCQLGDLCPGGLEFRAICESSTYPAQLAGAGPTKTCACVVPLSTTTRAHAEALLERDEP